MNTQIKFNIGQEVYLKGSTQKAIVSGIELHILKDWYSYYYIVRYDGGREIVCQAEDLSMRPAKMSYYIQDGDVFRRLDYSKDLFLD